MKHFVYSLLLLAVSSFDLIYTDTLMNLCASTCNTIGKIITGNKDGAHECAEEFLNELSDGEEWDCMKAKEAVDKFVQKFEERRQDGDEDYFKKCVTGVVKHYATEEAVDEVVNSVSEECKDKYFELKEYFIAETGINF